MERDIRVQTSDCGSLRLKECKIEGQEGDGFITKCSDDPIYEAEMLVIDAELKLLSVDSTAPDDTDSDEEESSGKDDPEAYPDS
ncbi:MAG: hypothetical protein WBH75_08860 [Thermoanaerobaculia bacterium]